VSGRKFARLASAARALKARLEGYRADDCNYAVWLKYARERQQEAAADTVHLELSVARSASSLRSATLWSRASPSSRLSDCACVKALPIRASGRGFA
jgi:hypothetical protein